MLTSKQTNKIQKVYFYQYATRNYATLPFFLYTHTKGVRMVVTTPNPKIRMLWVPHRHFEPAHTHTHTHTFTYTHTHTHTLALILSHTHTHSYSLIHICMHIQTFVTCRHSAYLHVHVLFALLSLFNTSPHFPSPQ